MNDLFIQGLTIDWNRVRPYNYVRQIPAISGIDTFTFHKPITFFVGENGSGKSTLLEAIAVAYGFNAEGGTKNYSFSTYNSHSELCEAMTISKGYRRPKFGYFLRAESFYNCLSDPAVVQTRRDHRRRSQQGGLRTSHALYQGQTRLCGGNAHGPSPHP